MGASAGGLEAFEKFFTRMDPDSGLAFILVPHLDAHHKSAMTELVQRYTRMKVTEISDGMPALPDRVHVIPPNATLTIEQGRLRLTTPRGPIMTIDTFLRSLAEDQGENAIAVILSGSGSDGTLGIRAIKERGGLTVAQAAESSRYGSMPHSAAATGLVDLVLPVEEMPAKLRDYAQTLDKMRDALDPAHLREDTRKHLVKIYALLRAKTGHDFSQYKDSTFIRRVQRRMQVAELDSVPSYVELLRSDSREPELLFRDLLIGVTHFFRDTQAFEALASQVIPNIIANKRSDDSIRVWVPGCATGEEAYSIAILLREQLAGAQHSLKAQIFATNIDDRALEVARIGRYPESIAGDLSAARLQRFFVRAGNSYRIHKEIREMCIFSLHNVIKDAPFSKLDLISCRNLLIYLDANLQNRVIPIFHFALRHGGYLLLGPSENVTQHSKLFTKVDGKYRIFKARPVAAERPPMGFPPAPGSDRSHGHDDSAPAAAETLSRRAARVMDPYAPAYVVVDEHFDVMHFSGRTGKYLQPSPGTASLNLFNILETGLRSEVRTVLHRAMSTNQRTVQDHIYLHIDGGNQAVRVIVEPMPALNGGARSYVVGLQDMGPLRPRNAGEIRPGTEAQKEQIIDQLEAELVTTRERLQATVEELETSNEEMKASNEEFQSVNEELQSSNEELETSKEELQSMNEELETVNAELNSKLESLERAANDRKNLLESTQIATIFLDNLLHIKSFTPAITDIFHLIDTDYGRPITDIVTRLAYDNLEHDVRKVLRTLSRIEQEVAHASGSATYMMRILPYRTLDNAIDGVVITFIDITEPKRNEEALARLAAIVESSHDAVIGITPDGKIGTWNAGAERLYGHAAAKAIGQPLAFVVTPEGAKALRGIVERIKRSRAASTIETERITKDGKRIFVASTMSPIRNGSGKVMGVSAIERDITARRLDEERQKMLLSEFNHRVKNTLATVLSISSRTSHHAGKPEEFKRAFEGRIRALAAAHELLAESRWSGASLREIVLAEAEPYRDSERMLSISGDRVLLNSKAALLLGMVTHELATNAAKHGALSTKAGRVDVSWEKSPRTGAVTLEWVERHGPRVKHTKHGGFWLKFIERGMSHELGGQASFDLAQSGLRCRLLIPASALEGTTQSRKRG